MFDFHFELRSLLIATVGIVDCVCVHDVTNDGEREDFHVHEKLPAANRR